VDFLSPFQQISGIAPLLHHYRSLTNHFTFTCLTVVRGEGSCVIEWPKIGPDESLGMHSYSANKRTPIFVTLLTEALSSSETSVLTRATQRNIPEDAILHSHRRENLKSYTQTKKTPWPLVRKRTIPTERPPLVGEIWCQLLQIEGCRVLSAAEPPRPLISVF
jgi:hypothetical protein